MAVPARFRELLSDHCAGKLVVTIDPVERCLSLYPLPRWEEIQAQIEKLPTLNPQAKRMQRLFIGHACDCELDANGRFLLPAMLRNYAELEKKLILLGQGQKIEIWSETRWNNSFESMLADVDAVDELPDSMQQLSF